MAVADRLHRAVVEALSHDRLTLPTLPEVALRVRELAAMEEITSARLAAEIGKDPAISVRVMRVANSAAQRGAQGVDSLRMAVTRLGFDCTRLLVSGLAVEQLFDSSEPALRTRLRQNWQRSVDVAARAKMLAMHCTALDPERALLAGLVHEVGVLPIVRIAESQPGLLESAAALDEVIAALAPQVGRTVLQAWHFPAALAAVPAQCDDLTRTHDGPADYVDVVCIARLLSTAGDAPARTVSVPVPAFAKLELRAGVSLQEIGGGQQECDDALALLGA